MRVSVASFLFLCASCLHVAITAAAAAEAPPRIAAQGKLSFPHALPGEEVIVVKVVDSEGNVTLRASAPWEMTADELEELRVREREMQRARYGNLSPELYDAFDNLGPTETIPVLITLRTPEVRHPNKYEHDQSMLEAHSRALLAARPLVPPGQIVERHRLSPRNFAKMAEDGVIEAEVDRRDLQRLARDPDISTVDPVVEPELVFYQYNSYNTSAFNPGPMPYRARGSGVRAGTFESGIHPDNITCMGLNPSNIELPFLVSPIDSHSDQTFRSMWLSAPLATHYHRNDLNYSTGASQSWIVNNGVQTLSQSTMSGDSHTTYRARVMDDFAYRSPFTVFANPTANGGFDLVANWLNYNSISVGNVQEVSERYYQLSSGSGCTQTRNPVGVYGSQIPGYNGDREMPNLVAPGVTPFTDDGGAQDSCLGSFGLWCGTSISAPVVNGIAASVIGADSRMRNSTERVKAALILTARNVEGNYTAVAVDERDGAGVVSGADAVWFARNHTSVALNGEARHGMASGTLTNANEGNIRTFYIRTPFVKPIGKHLRAVLVWTSNPELNANVNTLSDLDLSLRTSGGTVLAGSYSLDDNVEIIDIPSDSLATNTLYTLKVHVTDMRITANASANFLYYAVGWTWVQDIFLASPVRSGYSVGVQTMTDCAASGTVTTLNATANKLCTEMGNKASGAYALNGPTSGVHSWWNGTSWATSGNNLVCYIKDLRCEGHDVPHFANPAPIAHYQLGVATTSCVASATHNNSAARFCVEQGFDTYDTFSLDGPKSGTHTWWTGSAWSTSGNNNVCYILNLKCRNL